MESSVQESALHRGSQVKPYRIDTHQHLFPRNWVSDHGEAILAIAPGMPASIALDWTPQQAIEAMDRFDIAAAVLSMSTPGVWFGDVQKSRSTARYCNEYGARLVSDHPGRFGMFAILSLIDVEGSLREIEYALDVLKLDGIGLLTSYTGRLLGDAGFAPVFDELNRRKTVVFVHPTMSCCGNLSIPYVNNPSLEFPFDTTRTISSLLFSGTFARCPDIRFRCSTNASPPPSTT
jgi:6-methylsalicylate decarboxylase